MGADTVDIGRVKGYCVYIEERKKPGRMGMEKKVVRRWRAFFGCPFGEGINGGEKNGEWGVGCRRKEKRGTMGK